MTLDLGDADATLAREQPLSYGCSVFAEDDRTESVRSALGPPADDRRGQICRERRAGDSAVAAASAPSVVNIVTQWTWRPDRARQAATIDESSPPDTLTRRRPCEAVSASTLWS